MKSTLKVLSLVLVLVLVRATDELDQKEEPDQKDKEPAVNNVPLETNKSSDSECEELKKTIQPHDLYKVEGDWVAVWGVSDGAKGQALIPNITSSKLRLKLLNNKTLNFYEENFYRLQKWNCSHFAMNATLVDGAHKDELKLEAHEGMSEYMGKVEPFQDNVTMSFFQSCEHCLSMTYMSDAWDNFFVVYRREGHHLDLEAVKKEHGAFHKRAECLGFPKEPAFHYDGTQDFCHRMEDLKES